MYWLQISLLFILNPKKKKKKATDGQGKKLSSSQPPNVALALSASWEQLVLAAAGRLAATLP